MRSSVTTRTAAITAIVLLSGVLAGAPAYGTSVLARSVVDLISLSEHIVVGTVVDVHDGFNADGVPYTEIALQVEEALKGDVRGTYTFRQFGLLAPRPLPDGRVNLMVSPQGWPSFRAGERVVLFLYTAGSQTGFRTTVGLMQGKFEIADGQVENAVANRGLFTRVRADESLLSAEESKLLSVKSGPVDADAFVSFVRNTVRNRWIESGRVGHAR